MTPYTSAKEELLKIAKEHLENKSDLYRDIVKKHPELASPLKEKVKKAGVLKSVGDVLGGRGAIGEHKNELLGLGMIAAPVADDIQAHFRGGEDKKLLPEVAGHALDLGGLGVLAAPAARKLISGEH